MRVFLLCVTGKKKQLRVVRVEPRNGRRVLINGYAIAHLGGVVFDSVTRHHDVIEIQSDDESEEDVDVKPDPEPPAKRQRATPPGRAPPAPPRAVVPCDVALCVQWRRVMWRGVRSQRAGERPRHCEFDCLTWQAGRAAAPLRVRPRAAQRLLRRVCVLGRIGGRVPHMRAGSRLCSRKPHG